MNRHICFWISSLLIFCGCQGYSESVRGIGTTFGAIQTRDIQQAQFYRDELPRQLNLAPSQVSVEPGSGITHVTISGVKDAEQPRIASMIEWLNTANPHLNPLKVQFR